MAMPQTRNRQSTFSTLSPFIRLPKYFESEWSYAQYRIPTQSAHISMSSSSARSPAGDIPDEERCVVGWIEVPPEERDQNDAQQYQLIALTYTGGWYRLSLPTMGTAPSSSSSSPPRPLSSSPRRPSSVSSMTSRTEKGKDRELDKDSKPSRECTLQEFRRFGRWDGWG